MGVTHEKLHSIKIDKMAAAVLKIDLAKAYNKVKWLYLRMVLMQLEMNLQTVK